MGYLTSTCEAECSTVSPRPSAETILDAVVVTLDTCRSVVTRCDRRGRRIRPAFISWQGDREKKREVDNGEDNYKRFFKRPTRWLMRSWSGITPLSRHSLILPPSSPSRPTGRPFTSNTEEEEGEEAAAAAAAAAAPPSTGASAVDAQNTASRLLSSFSI